MFSFLSFFRRGLVYKCKGRGALNKRGECLAHSMAELYHSRLNRDVKWEGVPVDHGTRKNCVLAIVFECWDLPVSGCVLTA